METIETKIFNRIQDKKYDAFTISDLLDLGSYSSISKSLKKLCDERKIEKLFTGVYCKLVKIQGYDLDFHTGGDPDIARALARKYNWNIINTGNKAMNWLGMSQQVPIKCWYLSDGPDRVYHYKKLEISFFHVSSKEVAELPFALLLSIQAIKHIGKKDLSDYTRRMIARFLNAENCKISDYDNVNIISWIKDELKIIEKDYSDVHEIAYFGKM